MTQEDKRYLHDKLCHERDKELLLKDLCARLPYGVICYDEAQKENGIFKTFEYEGFGRIHNGRGLRFIENIKPYLFPLSSMTEEQQEEFDKIYADDIQVVANNLKNRLDGQPYETNFGHFRHIDWLNKNHFDYRGLIPIGLAIDATGLNIY